MSAEFARRLIEKLNLRIDSEELEGTVIKLTLIIYRDSIQQVMSDMGHKIA